MTKRNVKGVSCIDERRELSAYCSLLSAVRSSLMSFSSLFWLYGHRDKVTDQHSGYRARYFPQKLAQCVHNPLFANMFTINFINAGLRTRATFTPWVLTNATFHASSNPNFGVFTAGLLSFKSTNKFFLWPLYAHIFMDFKTDFSDVFWISC